MVVQELKCQRCSYRFEAKVLDRDDPKEQNVVGSPVQCPKCHSTLIELVRVLRSAS